MLVGLAAVLALATVRPAAAQEAGAASQARVLDDFDTVEGWRAFPSDGVTLRISRDEGRVGGAMRLDYDFHGGGGYAIARKSFDLDLPGNYEFAFRVRGDSPPQTLEFKLIDPSGENVWWTNRRDFRFPREWTRVVTKKRHIAFAWGPIGGGEMRRVAAIELVVTAASGGKGTVWFDDFTFTPRQTIEPYTGTPAVRASAGEGAALVADADSATAWRAPRGAQWLELDFGRLRELGGMVLRWAPGMHATRYEVDVDAGDGQWERAYAVARGNGGADPLYLPETEARRIRLRLLEGASRDGYALRAADVRPVEWSASPNAFFASLAAEAPRGALPKYFRNVQSYWTIVGASGDFAEGLINEEGMVEADKRLSVEPFLFADGRLTTWADARPAQSLARGDLPIPSVRWEGVPLPLTVTTFVAGDTGASTMWARYRVENPGAEARRATLFLALRPFQVNPSWQFLSTIGGVTPIDSLAWDGRAVTVNDRRLVAATPATGFGAAPFDEGQLMNWLARGELPPHRRAADPRGWAAGALRYDLDLPAGGAREVWIAMPLHARSPAPACLTSARAAALGDSLLARTTREWERRLDAVRISIPGAAGAELARTIRSQLAYILVNRDGAGIQPGSRSYDRSWIRDGSLTSAALLRLGHDAEVRQFAEWYAPFQYRDGKVPCCVGRTGADPVPENDSHGQLIYLIAEYFRFTHDTAFARRMWPRAAWAVAYMDSLRRSRMTAPYYRDSVAFFGLLPQSISHEGYSAKPMHSFWDDAFGYKGVADAVELARIVGDTMRVRAFAEMRDHFRNAIRDAYLRTMADHRIDYLAGSVELGDFDATSTTTTLSPAGGLAWLPPGSAERTFDRYWEEFTARRDGRKAWENYTPYEHRVVGSFVRLGQPERAHAVLDWFMGHRRPAPWNHWAEVVWNDPATPKFIGDMPHTWVGSDFIRSVLDMFAHERDTDSALVVGAAVRPEWVEGPGLSLEDMRTAYGPLSLTMRREGGEVVARITGAVRTPRGGIVVHPPFGAAPRGAAANGASAAMGPRGAVTVRALPAEIRWRY